MEDQTSRHWFKPRGWGNRLLGRSDGSPKTDPTLPSGPQLPEEDEENKLMFQAFEWYIPVNDHQYWRQLARAIPQLKTLGVDQIWIPPGCKAASPQSNGYDIYDLYDLGEFDWKMSVPTKWGRKEELMELMLMAKQHGIGIIWDAVLNHKAAADFKETCHAVEVDPKGMNIFNHQLFSCI